MNFLPVFSTWQFAAAGLACASAPIIIHLLNRRRYRTVPWAAMNFIDVAMRRQRRLIRLRDLLLMLLRAAAILLFGLALAQPHFAGSAQATGAGPVHLVLLIDTSLSMNYQTIEGSLLDQAREHAAGLIRQVPGGSRISIVSVGGQGGTSKPLADKRLAIEALERLVAVDQPAAIGVVIDAIERKTQELPELPVRAALLTDMQSRNWSNLSDVDAVASLADLNLVDLAPEDWENAWVSELRVADGIADVTTPTTFIVRVEYSGNRPRDTQVTLRVDDTVVGTRTLEFRPGTGSREITFQHQFEAYPVVAGAPSFARVAASIVHDRLAEDDERHLMLPVVAALPVVFVDQYDDQTEDVLANRLGESRHLRRLLSPTTARSAGQRPLIKVRHHTIGQLTRDILADARLVVIAGIRNPANQVPLLLDYVRQGGRLVVTAGAEFDPREWTESAWLDGDGILPMPLDTQPLGTAISQSTEALRPLFIELQGLESQAYFHVPDLAPEEWRDLYSDALFFKAVRPIWNAELASGFRDQLTRKLEAPAGSSASNSGVSPARWLLWAAPDARRRPSGTEDAIETIARQREMTNWYMPQVVARLNDPMQTPLLVERRIGSGHVVMISSGVFSDWNNLPLTNAFLIFDRLLRTLIHETLPKRNFTARDQLAVTLDPAHRGESIGLTRPTADAPEPITVGFLASDEIGVAIQPADQRGFYGLEPLPSTGNENSREAIEALRLAVSGDSAESDLTPLSADRLKQIELLNRVHHETSRLGGAAFGAQSIWRWLALIVLVLLFVELVMLAWISEVSTGGGQVARGP